MSEETFELQLDGQRDIYCSNDLIKGKQKMTLREAQLLMIAMSQVVKEDKDFKTYTTTIPELAAFMDVSADNLYRDIEDICTNLLQRVVKIKTDDKHWEIFQWVSSAKYKDGVLTLRMHDHMKPYMIDLVSHYSHYFLGTMMSFQGYYATRLYQIIVCEAHENKNIIKTTWKFTIEELRELFQVKDKQYQLPRNLINKTIKPAIAELNKSGCVTITDYTEHKSRVKGSPLQSISFTAILSDKSKVKVTKAEKVSSAGSDPSQMSFSELAGSEPAGKKPSIISDMMACCNNQYKEATIKAVYAEMLKHTDIVGVFPQAQCEYFTKMYMYCEDMIAKKANTDAPIKNRDAYIKAVIKKNLEQLANKG